MARKQRSHVKRNQRNNFTMIEDDILRALVKKFGTDSNWEKIASVMPNRSARQCHDRWYYYLSPDIKKDSWTKEEDKLLSSLVIKFGHHWTDIAREIPGRTDIQIKNRFHVLKRQKEVSQRYKDYYPSVIEVLDDLQDETELLSPNSAEKKIKIEFAELEKEKEKENDELLRVNDTHYPFNEFIHCEN